jgi:large subunit ribosomal protein L22
MIKKVSATSKYIRVTPNKIDVIISKIRGKTYKEALDILKKLSTKNGAIVWQTLYSAVSNATNNYHFEKENLIIIEAFVNQGSILKRMRPRARGKAFRIEKKISHLTISVGENQMIESKGSVLNKVLISAKDEESLKVFQPIFTEMKEVNEDEEIKEILKFEKHLVAEKIRKELEVLV